MYKRQLRRTALSSTPSSTDTIVLASVFVDCRNRRADVTPPPALDAAARLQRGDRRARDLSAPISKSKCPPRGQVCQFGHCRRDIVAAGRPRASTSAWPGSLCELSLSSLVPIARAFPRGGGRAIDRRSEDPTEIVSNRIRSRFAHRAHCNAPTSLR